MNTLNKYSNFTKPQTGFNPKILKELVLDAGLGKIPEYKKNVAICYDEMKSNPIWFIVEHQGKWMALLKWGI